MLQREEGKAVSRQEEYGATSASRVKQIITEALSGGASQPFHVKYFFHAAHKSKETRQSCIKSQANIIANKISASTPFGLSNRYCQSLSVRNAILSSLLVVAHPRHIVEIKEYQCKQYFAQKQRHYFYCTIGEPYTADALPKLLMAGEEGAGSYQDPDLSCQIVDIFRDTNKSLFVSIICREYFWLLPFSLPLSARLSQNNPSSPQLH